MRRQMFDQQRMVMREMFRQMTPQQREQMFGEGRDRDGRGPGDGPGGGCGPRDGFGGPR